MSTDRLQQQIAFLLEIDRLKDVLRRSYVIGSRRRENSAEHSWHVALMAVLLAEYANEPVDVARVVKMMLVHDIVEVDAGDVFIYDGSGNPGRAERERQAADRLFGMLPQEQACDLRALWEEFEEKRTAEARFAGALDRLMPLLHNYHTQGKSWQEHGVTCDRVLAVNAAIGRGAEELWRFARGLIEDAVDKGYLGTPPGTETKREE